MEIPEYSRVLNSLSFETAIVTFKKKDNTTRVMICSRNRDTIEKNCGDVIYQLIGHDRRCNIKNGNISVIDLAIGEARSFNINNVINIQFLGEIVTEDEYNIALAHYLEIMKSLDNASKTNNMDSI